MRQAGIDIVNHIIPPKAELMPCLLSFKVNEANTKKPEKNFKKVKKILKKLLTIATE